MNNNLTHSEKPDTVKYVDGNYDIRKITRRIVDWMFKTAQDKEILEIAKKHNIKTD